MTRFETLIDQYHDEIYRYLWRLLPGAGQAGAVGADDLTQEVFLRAYRSFSRPARAVTLNSYLAG